MALIDCVRSETPETSQRSSIWSWLNIFAASTYNALNKSDLRGGVVQISVNAAGGSTFGGGAVTLAGSNDGVTYVTLKDVFGNAITTTANAIFILPLNLPAWIKPTAAVNVAGVDVIFKGSWASNI